MYPFMDTAIDDLESFVNYPDPQLLAFPSFALFHQHQANDEELQAACKAHPERYPIMNIGDCDLVVYVKDPTSPWQIVIPEQILDPVIHWYHQSLNHADISNLTATIAFHYYLS